MHIYGLQKLTLLDYPGKVACTIFTGGCNFLCPFCHNASLVTGIRAPQRIDQTHVLDFLDRRKGVLDGVCISGGEPLLQKDIPLFIKQIKQMGYAVKLDTNGSFPERLQRLMDENLLDYVAMDIKNSPDSYAKTVGKSVFNISPIFQSAQRLLQCDISYEFRTTAVRELHTSEDFAAIARWLRGAKQYFIQAFIDSGDLIGDNLHGFSREELEKFLHIVRKDIPHAQLRGI